MERVGVVRRWVIAGVLVGMCAAPSGASASVISLATGPVTGTASPGQMIDVVVGFDPNGTSAANVVSHFLSLGYTGLARAGVAVNGSVYDGFTVFDGTSGELIDSSGDYSCATPGTCSSDVEARGYVREWQSALALLPPAIVQGPGSLFSLRLHPVSGATAWSFDLFGDIGAALFSEPPFSCNPADIDCGPQPEAVPFLIVRDSDTTTPAGTARVTVGVRVTTPPPPVPEPPLVSLTAVALAGWAYRRHRVR